MLGVAFSLQHVCMLVTPALAAHVARLVKALRMHKSTLPIEGAVILRNLPFRESNEFSKFVQALGYRTHHLGSLLQAILSLLSALLGSADVSVGRPRADFDADGCTGYARPLDDIDAS